MEYTRDPKPDILRIEELVNQVKIGDIKLPKFQRPFVWKRSAILQLWDSIYKGYPIGSILLWLTHEKLASERKIGDLEINARSTEYPTNYLLDGQQRLSSLCGALYWDSLDSKSLWNICFDLERERFLHPENDNKIEYFPLNKLLGTFDFINQCRLFENHPNKEKYEKNAQSLLKSVKDYKVAAVRIGDMGLNEVAPIFERINSSGRQLTIVDLMRAATWKEGQFDLNEAISSVRQSLEVKQFDTIPEAHIIRNISAGLGLGINREDINKLRDFDSPKLQGSTNSCIIAYRLAVDFLTAELPITSYSYLPYALQLTLLVEFFRLCPQPSISQRDVLKKWFWKSVLSGHFGKSNTGQNTQDVQKMRDFATGQVHDLEIALPINYGQITHGSFQLRKADSKAFALLLAHKRPKSLLNGTPINTTQVLSIINRHEYHHIFPVAFLKSSGVDKKKIDAHSNICMLNLANNRTISDSRPKVYFAKIQDLLGDQLHEVLYSNYINEDALAACMAEDYEAFLSARSKCLISTVNELCEVVGVDAGQEAIRSSKLVVENEELPDYEMEDEEADEAVRDFS